jgi:cytochrome P450
MQRALANPLPDHVPPHLVYDFPFRQRGRITVSPTPWEMFDQLLVEAPSIYWTPHLTAGRDGWVINHGPTIHKLLADTEHFSNSAKFPAREAARNPIPIPIPSLADPPAHGFYKKLLYPRFTPSRMAEMENDIRAHAQSAISKFKDRGSCEFMADFALEFPIVVFLELMGLPQDRKMQFLEWERELIRGADTDVIANVIENVTEYLTKEVIKHRENPRDDLISYGIYAEYQGRSLDDGELLGYCLNLFLGGLDTVSAAISHQFIYLARDTILQQRLRENPALIPAACDEMIRAFPVIVQMRDCIKPVEILGQMVMPGDRITMPTQTANRDPAVFERPGEIILGRKANHVAFGTGPHFCLGIHLAQRELRIAVQEFLAAVPPFRLDSGAAIAYDIGAVIQPISVPLSWS